MAVIAYLRMTTSKRNRLLKELLIDDNIHSKVQADLWDAGDGGVRRKRTRDRHDKSSDHIGYNGADDSGVQPEKNKDKKLKTIVIPSDWNEMNSHVQFSDDRRIITIRYNPLKLLDFNQVLNRGSDLDVKVPSIPLNGIDFEIYETENLLTSLDNDAQFPYRGAIENKQDYTTHRTIPRVKDREFFLTLLRKSQTAARFNGNTLLAFPNDEAHNQDKKRLKPTALMHSAKTTNVEYVYFQNYEIKTWYKAPYPEEYNKNEIIYICDKCLKYMSSKYVYYRHQLKCDYIHPPGNQIYRDMDQGFAIWEVDGRENVIYCQNLCLLAKLFLNSKTLYYDVEPFMFYTITVWEDEEWKFVGYFSKEKLNSTGYNLSCILTLPHFQRRGIGHLLMDFSYLLSRREFKLGTPEKPLSDLGLVSYRIYWKNKMVQTLNMLFEELGDSFACTIDDLSNLTGMNHSDVIFGLEQIGCLYKYNDEASGKCKYAVKVEDWDILCQLFEQSRAKMKYTLDPSRFVWKHVIFGPSCGINAVGTMVETNVSQQRITSAAGSTAADPFKQSISVLTNFMSDDLADPRTMEEAAMEKIKQQTIPVSLSDKSLVRAYTLPSNIKEKIIKASKIKPEFKQLNTKLGGTIPALNEGTPSGDASDAKTLISGGMHDDINGDEQEIEEEFEEADGLEDEGFSLDDAEAEEYSDDDEDDDQVPPPPEEIATPRVSRSLRKLRQHNPVENEVQQRPQRVLRNRV